MKNKKKVKLVLSGSGTLYPVHAGGLIRLREEGYEITEVCGTSGGAIVAAALGSGYDANWEIVDMIKKTLPAKNNLIDYSLWALFTKWGFVKGERIEKIFEQYMVKTLGETKIPLHIVTVDIERRIHRVFSSDTDPDMSLPLAVRASMSIPGVFTPVKIGDSLYVDGGVAANYFLDIFGTGADVIGLRFHSAAGVHKPIKCATDYLEANLDAMMEASTREHIEDAIFARTVILKTTHRGLNFKMTEKDVDEMVQEGYESVDRWIKKQNKK